MKAIYIIPVIVLAFIITPNVFAYRGPDYSEIQNPDGTFTRTLQTNTFIQASNGTFVPYILTQQTNDIKVETSEGSFDFNKNTCTLSFYNGGYISGQQPTVGYDSYTVKAELNGTTTWNNVNVINNASCVTSVIQSGNNISVIGTKSSAGAGTFTVNYTKIPGMELKTTLSATNNNPAWTNYHIGLTQTIQVPRIITLGNTTYDLSQHNGTVLNREWISSHSGQLIQLSNKVHFNMGLGWNNVNQITIYYSNNQATIAIDYTRNTPILQPGHTITIDPTFGFNSALAVYSVNLNPTPAAATCPTSGYSKSAISNDLQLPSSGSGANFCILNVPKFNTTGIHAYQVTQTIFQYKLNAGGSNMINCDYNDISGNHDPATVNAQTLWNDANNTANGTGYVTNDATCTTTGTKNMTLGNTANSDALTSISRGWFAVGWTFHQKARDASLHDTIPDGSLYKIQLTYNALNPPTLAKAKTLSASSINVTWASATGATKYEIKRASPNGGVFSQIANTTSLFYTDTGITAGTQYQYEVFSINGTNISIASNTKSNYTTNIAPTSLAASSITKTTARISWTNPSGNFSGFKIEQQPNHGSWSTVVSNTANSTNHRDLSGLTTGTSYGIRISTNYAVGSNYSGTSSPSTILNFTTYTTTSGTITPLVTVVGDAAQINGTTNILQASPSPTILKTVKLYINGSLYNSTTLNQNIANGSNYNFTWWYQYPNNNNETFHLVSIVTNATGTPSQSDITIGSTNSSKHRQYDPSYFTAKTPALGLVNYTISRPTPTNIILAANRDVGGTTFPMECLYQTATQAMSGSNAGTWVNKTSIGYWYQSQTVTGTQVYYITCYDPAQTLFITSSLVNGSSILFGISGFDNTFGAFLGLPVGVFFIVMAAALGNRRTAPMWVVIILAIAGLMATIGFFTLDQNVWYLAIIAGLLGLFVGRKLF